MFKYLNVRNSPDLLLLSGGWKKPVHVSSSFLGVGGIIVCTLRGGTSKKIYMRYTCMTTFISRKTIVLDIINCSPSTTSLLQPVSKFKVGLRLFSRPNLNWFSYVCRVQFVVADVSSSIPGGLVVEHP